MQDYDSRPNILQDIARKVYTDKLIDKVQYFFRTTLHLH